MQDLYDKYHIILDGKKRLYIYPLPERLYDLKFTSPVSLKIGNQVFNSQSIFWLFFKWRESNYKFFYFLIFFKVYQLVLTFIPNMHKY